MTNQISPPVVDENILTSLITANYESPPFQSWNGYLYDPTRPIFTVIAIPAMMNDPRVTLGLKLRTGPITSNSRFYVDCEQPEVKQFIADQINRFWRNSIDFALASQEFGYQPCEVIYRNKGGVLQFDRLKHIHPRDASPVTLHGMLVGMQVSGIEGQGHPLYIGSPKVFWTVHNRKRHRWFGDSVLRGAFQPWYEKWAQRGYRDQRTLWFFKNSFQGPVMYFPKGSEAQSANSGHPFAGSSLAEKPLANRVLAQKIVDSYTAGAGVAIPRSWSNSGQPDWELEPPQSQPAPQGLLQYGHDLNDEIWEGMEIPPEIARSGGGSGGQGGISIGGQGGRDIPQQAFYSILHGMTLDTITDLDEQIISFLVRHRFGPEIEYEIECFGLLRDENSGNSDMDGQAQGDSLVDGSAGDEAQAGSLSGKSGRSDEQTMSDLIPSGICYTTLSQADRRELRRAASFNFSYRRSA